jgi:anti-anti-sigma factor
MIHDDLGAVQVIRVVGEADLSTAPELRAMLEGVGSSRASVILDLSACRYFDSTVISVLVRAMSAWGERFAIAIPENSPLRRILAICDLDGVLPIERSVFDAKARARTWGQ